ncbi:FtsK/SpoIIIE domain-containing protein [Blastococcus litoris]|uniref:FtsK/SpoIIIE domain-containing protein n=1 Tax=Blastococcus litoris TaxID=2171622 RepID=UPI0013DF4BB3|nr:FtsK/SpoIIIE domain-containing protein [Blastococcus litoris]
MIPAPADLPSRPPAARCWTLTGDFGAVDVEVVASADAPLSEVLTVVAELLGRPVEGLWAGSTRLADDTPLTAAVLDHGAVLGVGRPGRRIREGRPVSALELHVVGGPDAGRTIPLGQGEHVVGRSGDATIRLADPDVSRRHVVVHVGGGTVRLADLGSSNGSLLDDHELAREPCEWPTGAVLRLGASALRLTGTVEPSVPLDAGAGGRRRVRPLPRLSAPAPEVEVRFPRPPAPAPRRRLALIAIAVPAIAGVAMAWLLHTPTFLFFALLSPVVALGTWLSERWNGRRSGRREAAAHAVELHAAERRLADAVRMDVRTAEAAHPDLATVAGAVRRRTSLLWSRSRSDDQALVVRIGSGPGPTRVSRIDGEGARERATAPHVPVLVELRGTGGLGVVGPRERATGVLRSILAQLCSLHAPGEVDLLLLSSADRLRDWTWVRWLPHLDPAGVLVLPDPEDQLHPGGGDDVHRRLASITAARRAVAGGPPEQLGWLVVVVDGPLEPRSAAALRGARDLGVVTVALPDGADDIAVEVDALLRLTGETGDAAVLSRQGVPDREPVVVDRLALPVAAEIARDLGALEPGTSHATLPREVRLLDLVDGDGGSTPGPWPRDRDRLLAPLGRTAHSPLVVDLCRQGPHALVAGTTGSGKSELLQTLIAGLAVNHAPDRCSFLLVDYKGGAAFAEAAALPHTVGLLTDLDGQTTARALRSLAAELTRREQVLADHGVADIAALPPDADLARLVIVVDEFAGLSDELPEFVPGLIAIAQRGRSLGVHLVLATQRPSGVVSPEIRANCSLRICLRTTDEAESRDVLGTPQAAHLPLDRPGRAWLRSGSAAPTLLQVARVAAPAPVPTATRPTVRPWTWPVTVVSPPAPRPRDGDSDLARLCTALVHRFRTSGARAPHRPWCPPLPDRLAPDALDEHVRRSAPGRALLPLGLVDDPERQTQHLLQLDLDQGGTWLAVGGPRSGRSTLLRAVLAEAVSRFGPDELHVHVLEAGAGTVAAEAGRLPHGGTVIGGEDALRTVRLVDRLAQEVADRRSATSSGGRPTILLLVDGVEAISTLLDENDPGRGSGNLLRVMRDGAAVGVTCVATAERAIPGGRLAAVARQRLVLPLPDRADYAVAGISARSVPAHRPPGRALVGEEARECQLALPRPVAPALPSGTTPALPLRIAVLPADALLPLPEPALRSSGTLPLVVGPGGDEGGPMTVDLLRTGGLLVSGPPGSGRSSALTAFAQHVHAMGAAVLVVGRPPWADTGPPLSGARVVDRADESAAAAWIDALEGRPGVVVADDLGNPADAPALTCIPVGSSSRVALLAAAHAGQLSTHYQGPVAALRRNRTGVLLCPGPGDADLLGVRLPRTPVPQRPGSGWLVAGGTLQRVQVARREASAGAPEQAQSSSSAEPISWLAYQASS